MIDGKRKTSILFLAVPTMSPKKMTIFHPFESELDVSQYDMGILRLLTFPVISENQIQKACLTDTFQMLLPLPLEKLGKFNAFPLRQDIWKLVSGFPLNSAHEPPPFAEISLFWLK